MAFFTSPQELKKCSFNQVADSEETSGLPVTLAADEANLNRRISVPSVSGISTTLYKSNVFAGEPCD